MINDYRFRTDSSGEKTFSRLLKPALAALILSAAGSAVYWTLEQQPFDSGSQQQADHSPTQTEPQIYELALPERQALPASGSQHITPPESGPTTDNMAATPAVSTATTEKPAITGTPTTAENVDEPVEPETQAHSDHAPTIAADTTWIEEKVKRGDSLAKIFSRLGLSPSLLHRIVNSSEEAKQLARIKPGETLRVLTDDAGNLIKLVLQRNAIRSLHIQPGDEGFLTRLVERQLETRIAQSGGTITNSLYESAQRAGLSDDLIMELANIFGWDIDFALEIRAGDSFNLIYEEEYLDGELFDNGNILAAEFVNRGNVYRAIRFQDEQGNSSYFSPDGSSMRKAFLRAPVDFRRISSGFRTARWHPVLGKKRPHKGVDYAAATGTPIRASGDGRVIFRGKKGGYGRTVIIKHGNQYTTLYAHMSRFNGKVKNGSRVQQGQTIGYVGKSGLATGPHLHYEFRVNGIHRNPLTGKIPAAAPIDKRYKSDFKLQSEPLLARLDLLSRTQLATAE